jgi:hypothetical protein
VRRDTPSRQVLTGLNRCLFTALIHLRGREAEVGTVATPGFWAVTILYSDNCRAQRRCVCRDGAK